MVNYSLLAFLFFTIFSNDILFSQIYVEEGDLLIQHFDDEIYVEIKNYDEKILQLKAYDVLKNTEILVENKSSSSNAFFLMNTYPAQIIRLEYLRIKDIDTTLRIQHIASISASSGAIKAYFNHNVDTTFKQTQSSINLSNHLDDTLISYINRCNNTLDIAIYNSYSPSAISGIAGAINAAYGRGVVVRIIYDGSTSSAMIPLLNSAIPTLASPNSSLYGIMHNKFVIFDANNVNPDESFVWTGSTNWTEVQIDGPDKNNVILFQDQSLALAYTIEFEEMWGGSGANPSASSKFGPDKTNNTPHTFIIGGKTVESYFSPSDGTTSKIIDAINSANSDINIPIMVVTRTDISSALLTKFNNGFTNINVINDTQNPSGNQFPTIKAGILPNHAVTCGLSGIMHHKFMVVDNFDTTSNPLVLTGSHNWSNSAETRNDENTVIVHDANIANQYYQAFAYLYLASDGIVNNTTGINQDEKMSDLIIYPNPSSGVFTFNYKKSNENIDINIFDVFGKKIESKNSLQSINSQIDLTSYVSGVYIIEVLGSNTKTYYKIIKD